MNAYLVIEDNEAEVWIALTMQRALELAWCKYIKDNEISLDDNTEDERLHYEQEILQSCNLVGEVANP